MKIANKIALVTGGSRGLGKNYALSLARAGADVILTYHSRKEDAEAVIAEIEGMGRKAAALQLNAGETKSFDSFFEQVKAFLRSRWGREQFDFLVNNAGIDRPSAAARTL